MAVSPHRKVTVDEWLTFPEDHTELIDGEVLELPQATKRHQLIAGRFFVAFERFTEEHGGGQAYLDVNVVISKTTRCGPTSSSSAKERTTPTTRSVSGEPRPS